MVTIAFLGDLGSAKTTLCTRQIILTKMLHPNKKIYCNYELYNYEYTDLDLMDLYLNHQEVRDTIIAIDEIYTMMDSRLSGSHRNQVESYFVAMTRKAKADLFVTMQYETFVDCRLSPFVKVKYIMETIPVIHYITLNGIQYSYTKPHPFMFKCTLYDDRNSNNPICKEFTFNGSRWFKEFNTDQYILPPKDVIERIKIKQMKQTLQYQTLKNKLENGVNNEKKLITEIKKSVKKKNKSTI